MDLNEYLKKSEITLNSLVKKYYNDTYIYGIEYDDLYQVGMLALIESYKSYDEAKGSVSIYAYYVVMSKIIEYIGANCCITRVPFTLVALEKKLANVNIRFYQQNNRFMTDQEKIEWLDKYSNTARYYNLKKLLKTLTNISFYHYKDKAYYYSDDIDKDDFPFTSDYDLEEDIISKIWLKQFISSLYYLTDYEKTAFIETLGLIDNNPKTNRKLAEIEHVNFQTINNRYNRALEKIKKKKYF